MKRALLLIPALLFLQILHAQRFEVGAEAGYGGSLLVDGGWIGEGSENLNPTCKTGITTLLRTNSQIFVVHSGLFYQWMGDKSASLSFLTVPLGVDVEPGKKVRFIIGGGFFVSYLFATSGKLNPDLANFRTDFQFGCYLDAGLRYIISDAWSVYFKIQPDFALTKLYEEPIPNHFGQHYYKNIRTSDCMISLGLAYRIPKKGHE